ncbi:MAG: glycine zipper 2TM domain-containing protein [Usitatibacter sp.]
MKSRLMRIAARGALFELAAAFVPAAFAACNYDCGRVVDVKTIKKEGEASGAGAVIGGIAGGVLGHQVGSGRGKDVATVAGAAGGAYAGHQIEKSKSATTSYDVVVKMDDGSSRTFSYASATSYRIGDKVKIVDRKLTRQ